MGSIIIDINCDTGEGSGPLQTAHKEIFKYISSCNISCGFHAGDPLQTEQTIETEKKEEVKMNMFKCGY